ncbi:MAG: hypothetical protein KAX19_12685, partial [Candidatus Brocadiae bacterium]|nr:hypothetical protein [Candidatus Brocadiia bacterium]
EALADPDEAVRQYACAEFCEYAQGAVLPVRTTVRALEAIADSQQASYLMQEEAAYAVETVRATTFAALLAEHVDEVLAWRGQVAREAHAFRWDDGAAAYVVDPAVGADAVERWADAYRLSLEQAEALQRAVAGGGAVEQAAAQRVLSGLGRDLASALNCVAYAAHAVRLIAQEGLEDGLGQWAAAVQTGPKLAWGTGGRVADLPRRLSRLRRRAWVAALWARESFSPEPSPDVLAEAADDEDDWVKLVGLAAGDELGADPAATADRMRALCGAHRGEEEYCEPIGLAAVALLRADAQEAPGLAESALDGARIDFRMELTQQLLVAAQKGQAAARLEDYLVGKPIDSLPTLCLALALRGAGNSLEGLSLPPAPPSGEWTEMLCAHLGLRAMQNEPEAAERLVDMLRQGPARQRYAAAHYLGLARVRSAVLVLASIQDRSDAPYMLRGLCGASLIRRGYPAGPGALRRIVRSAKGRIKADLMTHLCRAVEDTIPLMLECKDVNVGRFV